MELIIGIDDAGRGPALGPMILAGVLINKKDEPLLKEWGAKDSKLLTPEKRTEIAEKIIKQFKHHIEIITAEEIDLRLKTINLNWLEAVKSAVIINNLTKDLNEKTKIIVDCPSPNIKVWQAYLFNLIENKELVELSCEHKADFNHLSVAAASILAKTTRDNEMEKLKQELNLELGSGYCSDQITCKCIEENLQILQDKKIIRQSWDTFKNAIAKKEQKKLF